MYIFLMSIKNFNWINVEVVTKLKIKTYDKMQRVIMLLHAAFCHMFIGLIEKLGLQETFSVSKH